MFPRIGIVFGDKKWSRMGPALVQSLAQIGLEAHRIDRDLDFDKGPFSLILHKLTDEIYLSKHDFQAQEFLNQLYHYVSLTSTRIYCSLDNIHLLMDRDQTNTYLNAHMKTVRVPKWIVVDSKQNLESPVLKFPLILKSCLACAGKHSHQQGVYHTLDELLAKDSLKDTPNYFPAILQEYIPHQTYYKVYIIGEYFYAISVPCPFGTSKTDRLQYLFDAHSPQDHLCKEHHCLYPIFESVSKELVGLFGPGLFGIDLVPSAAGFCAVDLNYFPTFRGISNPMNLVAQFVQSLIR